MPERKKLELELNKIVVLELLSEPYSGQSKFGNYNLYHVKNGTDSEYSFFPNEEVHQQLKNLKKGNKFEIIKLAEQRGNKIITSYDIRILKSEVLTETLPVNPTPKDTYFEAMLKSYQDALRIQEQLNGMVDVNRIAITLFIARSKIKGGELSD